MLEKIKEMRIAFSEKFKSFLLNMNLRIDRAESKIEKIILNQIVKICSLFAEPIIPADDLEIFNSFEKTLVGILIFSTILVTITISIPALLLGIIIMANYVSFIKNLKFKKEVLDM